MGLDAYVLCNCLKEGKVKNPPFDMKLMIFEENDYILNLPYEGNEDIHMQFDNWKMTACEHEGLRYADVWVSNWAGCSLFVNTLESIGNEHFPTILSEWPKANGGEMSSDSAAKSLRELDVFYSKVNEIEGIFLVDYETKEPIYRATTGDKIHEFTWLGKEKLIYGFNEDGFLIFDNTIRNTFFSSKDFTQTIIEKKRNVIEYLYKPTGNNLHNDRNGKYKVVFKDFLTGKKFICNHPISDSNDNFPKRIMIIKKYLDKSNYYYITEPLTRLFKASVETGNPVAWA